MPDIDLAAALGTAVGDRVPGIAIAVVGPEGVRATAAHGMADLASARPAAVNMVCPWFSMTKIVTATLAMRCAEAGTLDLEAPVYPLVPQVERLTPRDRARRITARHLLSHSAGLVNPVPVRWIHPADAPPPDPAMFLDGLLAKHHKLAFEPGSRSSYSNLGTLVLGQLLSSVTGVPFTDAVRLKVLEPLGMDRTGFIYTDAVSATAATGYHPRRSPMRLLLPRWVIDARQGKWLSFRRFLLDGSAYGGLVGSVADAATFVQLHLRDGELGGARLLSESAAREMREIGVPGKRYDLGLGWFRPAAQREADPPFVEHLGGGAGFYNVIRLYPRQQVGIAVMGNTTTYDIDRVAALALSV